MNAPSVHSTSYLQNIFGASKLYNVLCLRRRGTRWHWDRGVGGWYMPNGVYTDDLGAQYGINAWNIDAYGNTYLDVVPAPPYDNIVLYAPALQIDVGNFQDLYRILSQDGWLSYRVFINNNQIIMRDNISEFTGYMIAVNAMYPNRADLMFCVETMYDALRVACDEATDRGVNVELFRGEGGDIIGALAEIGDMPDTMLGNYAAGLQVNMRITNFV